MDAEEKIKILEARLENLEKKAKLRTMGPQIQLISSERENPPWDEPIFGIWCERDPAAGLAGIVTYISGIGIWVVVDTMVYISQEDPDFWCPVSGLPKRPEEEELHCDGLD